MTDAKQIAYTAQRAAFASAEAEYDADLEIAGPDRPAIHAATAKYEAALATARAAYNHVVFPGVFGFGED